MLSIAVLLGQDQALANLGYYYLYGRSVLPNLSLAMMYFKMAARSGNSKSCCFYLLLSSYGLSVNRR
ncbi:SEL1-like repeat protein [Streptococcus respiraculi]|uniref:SEL1-like repeat protein n=1 Tax=Streptococcus respiraculi TaxID=2021971 RepID=UPI000E711C39